MEHTSGVLSLPLNNAYLGKNMQKKNFKFSVAPFCEAKSRHYLASQEEEAAADEQTPFYMPKLRPSTALLLLMLAETRDGDVLLDPMGGSGKKQF
jgi:tRNA G10  N-methylase Trm11